MNVSRIKRRGLDRLLNRPNALRSFARLVLPTDMRASLRQALQDRVYHRPMLSPRDRAMLVGIYRDDILSLQRTTGRDLSVWLR